MQIGYSTGAVAFGDFRLGLDLLRPFHLHAVELSALRAAELSPLLGALDSIDLNAYSYVALHAPSKFNAVDEAAIVERILAVSGRFNAIIVHPDAMQNRGLWTSLGDLLCFENMDRRKPIGRTADELANLFDQFPRAGLCLDLGHAWQVDRTMIETRYILRQFGNRIRQLHVSEVNTQSEHVPLTLTTVTAFGHVLDLLPDVPWILEAVISPEKIGKEIQYVRASFARAMQSVP